MEHTPIAAAIAETLRTDLLIWVDLETTGLDVADNMTGMQKHRILEIGIHITDKNLNIIDEGFQVVIHHRKEYLLELMNDYVIDMHTKSGLLDRIEESSVTLHEAEQMAIDYIKSFKIKFGSSPICGNSISFDSNFINAQLQELAKVFHYRKLDVSSFKILAWNLFPEEAAKVVKKEAHRGLDDIKESIAELKFYRENIMK